MKLELQLPKPMFVGTPKNLKSANLEAPLGIRPAFKREFIDPERGIRMGRLEPNERITQIVKAHLVARHNQPFVIDKWGRGRWWRWICWLPRANRDAKPISSGYNFSCAKFFLSVDAGDRALQAGLQIERASVHPGRGHEGFCRRRPHGT